jgi:hypothetical protein
MGGLEGGSSGGGGSGLTKAEVEAIAATAKGEAEANGTPAITATGVVYVTPAGNDSHSGKGWSTAKLTIPAAISALPFGADGVTRNGIVEVGYGTWEVASSARKDKCKLKAASAVIEDASIKTSDLGSFIVNSAHIQEFAEIIEVTEGVSFKVNHTTAFTGEEELTIAKPAILLPEGVSLRGRGRMNGLESGESKNYPTLIKDTGTGVTIIGKSGTGAGKELPENASAARSVLEDMTVLGSSSNLVGYGIANCWGVRIKGVMCREHGQWGMWLGENAGVFGEITDVECRKNGFAGQTLESGGLYMASQPNVFTVSNVRCIANYGYGAKVCGVVLTGCILSGTEASSHSETGVGLFTSGAEGNGTVTLNGCWLEGSSKSHIKCGAEQVNITGTMFQGLHEGVTTPYAIESGSGGLSLEGCYFQNQGEGSIKEGSSEGPVSWSNCACTDALWMSRHTYANIPGPGATTIKTSEATGTGTVTKIKTTPELKVALPIGTTFQIEGDTNKPRITFKLTKEAKVKAKELEFETLGVSIGTTIASGAIVLANGAPMTGSTQKGVITSPGVLTSVALSSGVAWQNTTGGDVRIVLQITNEILGTALIKRGRTSSPETLGTIEMGAAGKDVREFYLPAGWYIEVTLTKATFTSPAAIQPA